MRRIALIALGLLCACAPQVDSVQEPTTAAVPSSTASETKDEVEAGTGDAPGADPSINESWRGEDIEPLVGRLEDETREIFVHRERVLEVVGPGKGQTVADIGAGSGFMSLLFAERVGPEGRVIAVDINPKMLERIESKAAKQKLANLETAISTQAAAPLAEGSVDLVFICDTYHHFEAPTSTMKSIRAALRDGGQVVLIDFERVPGETSERMMSHVRAGKEVFRQEVLDAGFELVEEHEMDELEENYVLRFAKRE
jgi:FkbM family methyltransferase